MLRRSFIVGGIAAMERASVAAPMPFERPKGLWVIAPPDVGLRHQGTMAALAMRAIDGVFIRMTWRALQPRPELFDWELLDEHISRASRIGKRVSLAVAAGVFTPDWVFQEGVPAFTTVIEQDQSAARCHSARLPVPWNDQFLKFWVDFLKALGTRYGSNNTVMFIKAGGINYQTWELLLPAHGSPAMPAGRSARGCLFPDEVALWTEVGYANRLVLSSLSYILSAYNVAFPEKAIALMTGDKHGFPHIAGVEIGAGDLYAVAKPILGRRLVAQDNALSPIYVSPVVSSLAKTTITGFQFGWPVTNEPKCNIIGILAPPCPAIESFPATMQRALNVGASYVEIFPKDALNPDLSTVILDSATKLRGK